MTLTHNLGYPRIGLRRELKQATESYWKGRLSEDELQKVGARLRRENWLIQKSAGIDLIPSNDFSFYDHVLDACVLFGAVPKRFAETSSSSVSLATYFAMARGVRPSAESGDCCSKGEASAMEMTKWFDTNYHYIVPEWEGVSFRLSSTKPLDEFKEALALGIRTKPVLIGPVTLLRLGKGREADPLSRLRDLLPLYAAILGELGKLGAEWVQLDEPLLATDLDHEAARAFGEAYGTLRRELPDLKLMVAAYFGDLGPNLEWASRLPVDAIHVDLARAPQQLDAILQALSPKAALSMGLVDGRNIWRNNFADSLLWIEKAKKSLGPQRLMLAPSCSLLHVPVSLETEICLDGELKSWMAFAREKLDEVVLLARAAGEQRSQVEPCLFENTKVFRLRRESPRIHSARIRELARGLEDEDNRRRSDYGQRSLVQRARLRLPLFPTTTIGSFPQTQEVRRMRAQFKKGERTQTEYDDFIAGQIQEAIRLQEEVGLDVLVHGEFERNDMVEYFGEQLSGFAFTENGWVQSYGSRCVKPPIIYGDVGRRNAMTLRWWAYAQSLTSRPVKAMLTGPVTILQWSFVRDDQPRSETCRQIAFAIREEVAELEREGAAVIQVDEPALREGLPLRKKDWAAYLEWAAACFRIATTGVQDRTQIHTHMCYCEFNDIMESIAALDADIISIEASRSGMELLNAFENFSYPNEIGPGVWDIHSPRVPSVQEMTRLLERATAVLPPERIWVNPDCGLKTRQWPETIQALRHLVSTARILRKKWTANGRANPAVARSI